MVSPMIGVEVAATCWRPDEENLPQGRRCRSLTGWYRCSLTASKSVHCCSCRSARRWSSNTLEPSLLLTGSTDFMRQSVYSAYNMLRGSAILYNYSGADHIMAPRSKVEYRAAAAQFFRWQLIKDPTAFQSFKQCSFCGGAQTKVKGF